MGTSWDPVDLRGLISRRSRIRIPPPLLPKPDHADKEVHGNNHDPSRAGFGFGSYRWASVAWSGASIRHQFHGGLRALLGRASAPASRSQRRRRTSCARRDGPRSARRAPPAASRRAVLVEGIRLDREGPTATGGTAEVQDPWALDEAQLRPDRYSY